MMLVQNADTDPDAAAHRHERVADRSLGVDGPQSRDYLFGTIVSQLVPDEARILAALADGPPLRRRRRRRQARSAARAAAPCWPTPRRSATAAGVSWPQNTATYLSRGCTASACVEFGPATDDARQPVRAAARRRRRCRPRASRSTPTSWAAPSWSARASRCPPLGRGVLGGRAPRPGPGRQPCRLTRLPVAARRRRYGAGSVAVVARRRLRAARARAGRAVGADSASAGARATGRERPRRTRQRDAGLVRRRRRRVRRPAQPSAPTQAPADFSDCSDRINVSALGLPAGRQARLSFDCATHQRAAGLRATRRATRSPSAASGSTTARTPRTPDRCS